MNRVRSNGKFMVIIALILVLIVAVGVAEEERTDAGGQWTYILGDDDATIMGYVGELPAELVFSSGYGSDEKEISSSAPYLSPSEPAATCKVSFGHRKKSILSNFDHAARDGCVLESEALKKR